MNPEVIERLKQHPIEGMCHVLYFKGDKIIYSLPMTLASAQRAERDYREQAGGNAVIVSSAALLSTLTHVPASPDAGRGEMGR